MVKIEASGASVRRQTEFCIDAFVEETVYVPAAARPVCVRELSPQLGRLVETMTPATAWRAWADGYRGWFVQGRICEPSDEARDQPTVHLIFRDLDAVPVTAGVWCRRAPAKWDLLQFLMCNAPAVDSP